MLPAPGQALDLGRWVACREFVEEYLSVVADGASIYRELGVVPPMALVARALGVLLTTLSLPSGTIHAAQELECGQMARLGDEMSCVARLSRPIHRGDWRFMSADFTMRRADGDLLLVAKTTVLVPRVEAGDE